MYNDWNTTIIDTQAEYTLQYHGNVHTLKKILKKPSQ